MHCPVENTFWEGMPHPAATRHLETNIDVAGRGRCRFLLRPSVRRRDECHYVPFLARERESPLLKRCRIAALIVGKGRLLLKVLRVFTSLTLQSLNPRKMAALA